MFSTSDKRKIRDTVARVNAQRGDVTKADKQQRMPLPVLAKADANVLKYAVGTFSLYSLTPDALVDSGDNRQAYALGAITAGDDVQLIWYGGEASSGYWGACACNMPSDQTSEPCCCDLITAMEDEGVITATERNALRSTMGCLTTQSCTGGLDDLVSAKYLIGSPSLNILAPVTSNPHGITDGDWTELEGILEAGFEVENEPLNNCQFILNEGGTLASSTTWSFGGTFTFNVAGLALTGPAFLSLDGGNWFDSYSGSISDVDLDRLDPGAPVTMNTVWSEAGLPLADGTGADPDATFIITMKPIPN